MARGRTGKPEPAADPGIGDFKAPRGSELWAQAIRADLQKDLHNFSFHSNGLGDTLDALVETGAWQKLNKRDNSYFTSLEDFCTAREPYGLGLPVEKVRAMLAWTFRGKKFAAHVAPDVHPTTRIPLASVRLDGGTQIRAGLTDATVAEYQAALDAGAAFPPVVVFFDGEAHWLADGFHRVAAHEAAGLPDVLAEVRPGTKRDALLFAVGANGHHGLPRTNADKRRAVTVLLQDEEWGKCSNRWVAERAAVSPDTVDRMRRELAPLPESGSQPEVRTGKDGRTINTANIGKGKRDHQTPIVSDKAIRAASLDNVLAAQIEAMTLATSDAAYTALDHALANEEIRQDKAKALRARWTERHRALVAAKNEPLSAPPPAPPSSGQVALELAAPEAPARPGPPTLAVARTGQALRLVASFGSADVDAVAIELLALSPEAMALVDRIFARAGNR